MSVLTIRPTPRSPVPPVHAGSRASIQTTTLDLLWISNGVACFAGGRSDAPLYRAVLVVAGPAETPRALASASPGAVAGYRALLGGVDHPFQVLVRPEPFEAAAEATRWDRRAAGLPPPLAALACEHAAWVRRDLPALGLLVRRAYLVVPVESRGADERPRLRLGARLRGKPTASFDADQARAVLAERCDRLSSALGAAGVAASRLDDLALARLYRVCWGAHRSGGERLDGDLVALFQREA